MVTDRFNLLIIETDMLMSSAEKNGETPEILLSSSGLLTWFIEISRSSCEAEKIY